MDSDATLEVMTNPYDSVPNPMAPQGQPQQPSQQPHPQTGQQQPPSTPRPTGQQPSAPRPTGQQPGVEPPRPYQQHWQPSAPQQQPSAPTGSQAQTQAYPAFHQPQGAGAQGGGASFGAAQTAQKPRRRTGLIVTSLVAACLIGGAAGFGGSALFASQQQPQTQSAPTADDSGSSAEAATDPGTISDVAAAAGPSVVTVQAVSQNGSGEGSGVAVAEGGYIVTNNHVVTLDGQTADAQITVETSDGRLLAAEIVGTDPIVDLAVIKVDAELPVVTFASSDEVRVGDTAIAIGAPLGLSNSVTDGIVSAVDRGLRIASSAAPEGDDQQESQQSPFGFWQEDGAQGAQEEVSIPVVQTDASINPGNSGGALLNASGQLVGVNVAIASMASSSSESSGSIGIGFAIEASLVQRVVEEIISTGEATHGLLGATVSDVTDASVGSVGAQVQELSEGGAAAEAGIRAGDVITRIDGQPITGAVDATAQVRSHAAGSEVTVTYLRDGQEAEAQVTLGALS
ncbi:S1C family serine protease [Agrococcus baldri]|uniref:Trypsin-like serine protease n=1 Tax=Agrococcus baldri TaxID=153730 RepID=A0AA87RE11_9MICO|nr:trypsin-like peptidase domain-containing protein [Agrococcus baldri]GEK78881.1 trypsin-like serine protease [Agrococcus baldri]